MTTQPTSAAGGTGRILGIGALACIACCIGPILGLLGAIGITTIAGTLAFGIAGLTIALLAIPVVRKHRRAPTCATPPDHEVAVAAPTVRRPD
jgi:hypothetical protein